VVVGRLNAWRAGKRLAAGAPFIVAAGEESASMRLPRARRKAPRLAPAGLVSLLVLPVLAGCLQLGFPDRHGEQVLEQATLQAGGGSGGGAGRDILLGAWLGSWPADNNPVIARFKDTTGVSLDLVDVYLDWQTPVANVTHTLHHIASKGAVPMLTWMPHGYTAPDILAGTRTIPLRDGRRVTVDAYIDEFAAGVCARATADRTPVLLRMLHEMNGGWFTWGQSWQAPDGSHPNTPAAYHDAWKKLHDAFTSRCGDKVRFVWALNHFSKGDGVTFTSDYPGDDLVDYVGIDGYNWGSKASWGWQSFDTLFKEPYCAATAASSKPVLLAEVASAEEGGDKAAWVGDLFAKLDRYPRIVGFVWFDSTKYEVEIHGTMDWAIDSSPAAVAAYEAGTQRLLAERSAAAPSAAPKGPC
jgi:hypothetical protein